jgi:PhnB protein
MTSEVKAIPEGYHTLTPHIVVNDGAKAIEFYKNAFGAEEIFRMPTPDGSKIAHGELKIGDSIFFLSDEFPEMGAKSPLSLGGTHGGLGLYVEDTDAVYEKAIAAGATSVMPPSDAFWGDRYGKVTDPFGHSWAIMTHIKDLSPEEIEKASNEHFSSADKGGGAAA